MAAEKSKNFIQSRHNTVLDIVARAVKERNPDTLIRKNSVVKSVHLDIH